MCGFVGFYGAETREGSDTTLRRMTDAIAHRGPDDDGYWMDPDAGIHLGFRRLSIIDLSAAGHQPMVSHSGRLVCVFNGEIYNYPSLRDRLSCSSLRGHSDTEVLLEHIEEFGLSETLARASGMFALAVWDRQERTLSLGRDRIGEKPLYYGWMGDTLLFGSELKALRRHPAFEMEVNRDVLAMYLQSAYVPAPWSIYRDIYKLPPATTLTLREGKRPLGFDPFPGNGPAAYWSFVDVVDRGREPISDQEAIERLDSTLRRVIASEMISDVPLGGFLSGGIDSSTVVAMMQAVSSKPVRSFTIGFEEGGFNEAEHAKAVAKHLGTDHVEHYVTPRDTLDVLPLIPSLYDEPFADPSQIPTFLVSKIARREVTVCLSGDGGDELFGGYNRYFLAERIWRKSSKMPKPMRGLFGKGLRSMPPAFYDFAARLVGNRLRLVGDKAHKFAELMNAETDDDMYRRLISYWQNSLAMVKGACPEETILARATRQFSKLPFTERMMATETLTYLPDDIMVKVDRAAMGVSLESRAPFLHHELVELAWSLPPDCKIRNGKGKWLLRQVLDRYVPRELIERPKMGFAVPIDSWLRGPLRDWAEPLLDRKRLEEEGYFEAELIQKRWNEHQSGRRNWQYQLWCVLMFQSWLDANRRTA